MKDFLKFTFATVVGIIISTVLLSFLSILMMAGMMATSVGGTETQVRKNSVMVLDLNGELVERSQDNPFQSLLGEEAATCGLDDVLSSIRKAKEHDQIKGIYIKAGSMSAGFASLEEIRKALLDFKESGKFIIAYADDYTQNMYYLSSVADKVMINPKGSIGWHGLASNPTYYKELLDKIGVEMQVFKVGTYKSAVEPFIDTKMSDANREQITSYIGSIWRQMLTGVSASRGISIDSLNELADRMMDLQPAEEYITSRLADTLIYKNDVRDYLKSFVGVDKKDKLALLGLKDMMNVKKNVPKDKSGNIVAVYYAFGEIGSAASYLSFDEGIVADKVIRDLRKLKEDEDIKAVVLRVNSPGGSAYDSEQIWHAVTELKKEKPVIVSMGDYAASGGYYISCAADSIVADGTTLTGSIGIFGLYPNTTGLTNKIGLSFDLVQTNPYAGFGASGRGLNDGEKELMQNMVNRGYELFVKRCADGRGMSVEAIKRIAEGRVWTGEAAVGLKLVDEVGGLDRALEMATAKAGVETYTVMTYPAQKSFFEQLMDAQNGSFLQARLLKGKVGELYRQIEWVNHIDELDKVQARISYAPNIH
ncbi:MAG: signal peptide peptidase SppA [Mediterranea sp.]|jgi:protease-4|nr:signal peptide peptidase SppA [Mediterranea sp.]